MKPAEKDHTWALVLGLGVTCTIGYGTVFYSFSLLSIEIENSFGWPKSFVFGVYSLGVFATGLIAARVGKILDRYGARIPMSVGSVLVAISLLGLSHMESKLEYIAFMLMLESISILVIYESAFVAITQRKGDEARKSISQITLMAGFASTLFWPLISTLLNHIDWRGVYTIMALMHLAVCLPLHYFVLDEIRPTHPENSSNRPESAQAGQDHGTEYLLAFGLGLAAFCVTGFQVQIFAIFNELEVSEKIAIAAGALIGPFQVLARLIELVLGRHINAYHLGLLSSGAMALGLLCAVLTQLLSPHMAMLFAVFFGIGQGLTNIVRGALPIQLFGAQHYGAITGRLNRIRLLMIAVAPVSFAFVIEAVGVRSLLCILIASCLFSMLFLQLATQRHRRRKDLGFTS